MGQNIVILIKRVIDHLKAAVEGRSGEHHEDSPLAFHQKCIHFWVLTWKGFKQNRCPVRASALAYTTLLALIPLLAVVASVSTSLLKSQGEKPIDYLIEKLVVNVAPQLDLVAENSEGSDLLSGADFNNPPSLVETLRRQDTRVSEFIWNRLSEDAKLVFVQTNAPADLQRAYLAGELNNVLSGESIYDAGRFENVALSAKTLALTESELSDQDQIKLNRLLLEDAFPEEIVKLSGRHRAVQAITDSIKKINTGKLGATGMVGLMFVAIMLLATIEATFNDIWGVSHGRNWLSRIIQYWATVTLGPLIPVLAIALNTGSQFQTVESWLSSRPYIGTALAHIIPFLVLKVIPFVVLSVAFALFYQLMPNTRVRWQAALVGGIVGGSLWQLNSLFSVVYVSRVATYTTIYGPLSLVPIFLIGLYFSWLILLFGAQVAYTFQNRQAYFQERQSESVNELGREFVALRIMTCLAQRFQKGQEPLTGIELGQALAAPTRLIGDLLSILAHAGLVRETDGAETGYMVARPLEKLTCQEILRAVRTGHGKEFETRDEPDRVYIQDQFLRIQNAEASVAEKITLATLARETEMQEKAAARNEMAKEPVAGAS